MYCRKTALARRLSFAFGSSTVAVAATFASPAFAQCSPEPTVAGGTTTCTGTDADGLRVTTDGSTVHVVPSASVTALDRSAITVDIDWLPNGPIGHSATIIVGGIVDGSAHSGIAVLSGSAPTESYNYYRIYPNVTVETGAIVTGATGITVEPSPGNYFGQAVVNISNAGAIMGTGGVALLATDPGRGSFGVIDNAQGGTIGAIVGSIGELNNAGSIDGGSLSAIDQTSTGNWQSYPNGWTNSGTIRSASAAATIANLTTPGQATDQQRDDRKHRHWCCHRGKKQ